MAAKKDICLLLFALSVETKKNICLLPFALSVEEFTYYPKELQPKFKRFRCRWTIMSKKEKKMGKFQRPKRWFPKKEYVKVIKQWVFGMTTSNGKSLQFLVKKPRTSAQWAKDIKNKVTPFLKKCFPTLRSYQILLDSEPLLHEKAPKEAMVAGKITVLPKWPKYSAQLNPQEHVWFTWVCTEEATRVEN